MSKLLYYSDTHIRESGSYIPYQQLDKNGLTKELNNILRGFDFLHDLILQIKPERVGLLGDFYNNTEFQTARVLYASSLALSKVKSACDQVGAEHDIISGNHDMLSDNHNITNIANLVGYGNVYLEPTYVKLKNGKTVAYIPAISNTGLAFSQLNQAQNTADLAVMHQDFQGCKYESGTPSNSPLPAKWNIPIISGDIHLPQDIGSVHYIGALIQNKFYKTTLSQIGGALVYDTDNKTVTRYRNNYSKHYIKFVDGLDTELPPPNEVVLQVVSSASKEEIAERFKDYEYYHVPSIKPKSDSVKVNYSQFNLSDTESILRSHVNKERPEAIDVFNKVIKSG